MERKGKIYVNKGNTVFVACPGGDGNCPKLDVRATHVKLRDDYSDEINTNKAIMQLIF